MKIKSGDIWPNRTENELQRQEMICRGPKSPKTVVGGSTRDDEVEWDDEGREDTRHWNRQRRWWW